MKKCSNIWGPVIYGPAERGIWKGEVDLFIGKNASKKIILPLPTSSSAGP